MEKLTLWEISRIKFYLKNELDGVDKKISHCSDEMCKSIFEDEKKDILSILNKLS